MKLNSRRSFYLIGTIGALISGILVSFMPLLGDFSIETAQLLGVVAAICGLVGGIRESRRKKESFPGRLSRINLGSYSHIILDNLSRSSQAIATISTLFRTYCIILVALLLVCLPVGVSAFIGGCLTLDGILFMALIPPISAILGISIGRFVSIAVPRRAYLFGFSVLFTLAALVPLVSLLFLPHVFLFNSIWGWFPGPIYDEVITFDISLLWHRMYVLTGASLLWVGGSWLASGIATKQIRWKFSLITVFFLLFTFNLPRFGIVYPLSHITDELGGRLESEHIVLVYDPAGMDENTASEWLFWLDFHYADLARKLEVEKPSEKVIATVYRDPWQKHQFTGARRTSYVPTWNLTPQLHLDMESGLQIMRHELVHVLSREFAMPVLRASYLIGLTEGLAVAFDDPRFRRTTHDELVAASQQIPDASELSDLFSFTGFYAGRGGVNYAVSGSFVGYLLENFGLDLMKQAYRCSSIDGVYEESWTELHEGWITHLSTINFDTTMASIARGVFGRESIFERECPRVQRSSERQLDEFRRSFARNDIEFAFKIIDRLYNENPDSERIWLIWSDFMLRNGYSMKVIEDFDLSIRPLLNDSAANFADDTRFRISQFLRILDAFMLNGEMNKDVLELLATLVHIDTSGLLKTAYKQNFEFRGIDFAGDVVKVYDSKRWTNLVNIIYRPDEIIFDDLIADYPDLLRLRVNRNSIGIVDQLVGYLIEMSDNSLSEFVSTFSWQEQFLITERLILQRSNVDSVTLLKLLSILQDSELTSLQMEQLDILMRVKAYSDASQKRY